MRIPTCRVRNPPERFEDIPGHEPQAKNPVACSFEACSGLGGGRSSLNYGGTPELTAVSNRRPVDSIRAPTQRTRGGRSVLVGCVVRTWSCKLESWSNGYGENTKHQKRRARPGSRVAESGPDSRRAPPANGRDAAFNYLLVAPGELPHWRPAGHACVAGECVEVVQQR